jgi:hypothetical protein
MSSIQITFKTAMSYTDAERESLKDAFADFLIEFGDDEVIPDSIETVELSENADTEKRYSVEEIREIMRTAEKEVKVKLFMDDEEFVLDITEAADEVDGE